MIQIPLGKTLNKTIPKEAFFRNLDITPDIKNKFVSDIKKITLAKSKDFEIILGDYYEIEGV